MGDCRYGMANSLVEIESILCSISQSNPEGAAHACSGNSFRGGVSPRFTRRLKGQSTIEYVLIIAIIVLVVLIAGPWVSSAIRNQFNLVAGTLGNGISKGNWESGGTGGGNGLLTDADIVDPVHGTAFAVYSDDDHSLMFYKRRGIPNVGDMFNCRRVTAVYTGFEDTEYCVVSAGSDGNSWDSDAVIDTPWFGRRKDIKTVQVVDGGIKPKSVQSWFQGLDNATDLLVTKLDVSACASFSNTFANCRAATSIDVSRWSAKPADMTQMFYMCESVPSLDLSGFDGSRNITLNSTFHACFALDDIKFGDKWTTAAVENFNCAFFGTKFRKLDVSEWNTSRGYMFRGTFGSMGNLEEIDISGWTNAGAENEPGILSTFGSDTKLRTVTAGTGWDWSKSNAKLPAISGEDVAGADGKWYAASDGKGYAPVDIPSGKADTYYSVAPSTFAVYSADDGLLDFFNRAGALGVIAPKVWTAK